MLRHVVMIKLKQDAPADAAEGLREGLSRLPGKIPEIQAYAFGPDLGLREGNFDFCLVADFLDAEAFARYVVHPDHQRFVSERLTPVAETRIAVQFDLRRD